MTASQSNPLTGLLLVLPPVTLGLMQARWLYVSRRHETRDTAHHYQQEALKVLSERPDTAAVAQAILPLMPGSALSGGALTSRAGVHLRVVEIMAAWHALKGRAAKDPGLRAAVDRAERVVHASVNQINLACELIDLGLVSPRALLRSMPDLHRRLLVELALIEPFIWYRALADGAGRWGFRPIEFAHLTRRLSSISPRRDLRHGVTVRAEKDAERFEADVLDAEPRWSRLRRWTAAWLGHQTIDRRSKVRQWALAEQYSDWLGARGFLHEEALAPW